MKRKMFLVMMVTYFAAAAYSQPGLSKSDSLTKAKMDSIRWARLDSTAYTPLINAGKDADVYPIKGVDEKPDTNHRYRLLFSIFSATKDTAHKTVNDGLISIARVINLDIAAGVPFSKMDLVVIAHGPVLNDVVSDSVYNAKYHKPNPNTALIRTLMKNGVKFIACGQALLYVGIDKIELQPGIKVAFSAQVVIGDYLSRGYVKYDLRE